MLLEGKVAIITGASSGIGRAAAFLFAKHGARVVLNARGVNALTGVVAEVEASGGRACAVSGDVVDDGVQHQLVATARSRFGGLDIAFNNAGVVGPLAPLTELAPQDWQRVIDVNLTAAYLGARHQIPAMIERGGGSIVFTSSFVGSSVSLPGMTAYGTAKAALSGLVKGITADYAQAGIRANALLSGGAETGMASDPAQREWAAGLHAMRRLAKPEEIANVALFLVSGMASFVTGTAVWADGGNSAVK